MLHEGHRVAAVVPEGRLLVVAHFPPRVASEIRDSLVRVELAGIGRGDRGGE